MEIETEELIKKIRAVRKEKGISLLKLALDANISHSHLYYIETLQVVPSIDIVVKITKALKINLNELVN